ncbi:MAG: integral membrane protein [Erysipelotrichaceae bacterium]|nr:MAG: integral membrane [Erysipelotrichaceae bacterium]TXT18142.1 MAG: integral membrane protein [Erysipelotrichaceae bacterium]
MSELTGLGLGFAYIGIILAISVSMTKLPHEMSRTFSHIMVSNWWIIASLTMSSYWVVMVTPIFFVVFNTLNALFNWIPAINSNSRQRNIGTVYYAISVLFLTHLYFFDPMIRVAGGLGILVMGYGDGFAAVIGQFFGKHTFSIFKGKKSIEGSLAMLIVSMIVVYAYLSYTTPVVSWSMVIVIPVLATLIEAISPYGLDNLFVPLISALIYFVYIF